MKKMTDHRARAVAVLFAALLMILAAEETALAYPGGCHYWGAEAGVNLFMDGFPDPNSIDRDREFPLYPELFENTQWYNPAEGCCDEDDLEIRVNWDWVRICAQKMDDLDSDTRHHFWYPEEGLDECPNDVAGINNAWEEIQPFWVSAIEAWRLGFRGQAYAKLGYSMHFIQDMGQPAHANEDMHPGDDWSDDDSLEDWISGQYCMDHFNWSSALFPAPYGEVLYPPTDNVQILNDIYAAGCWDYDCDYDIYEDMSEEDEDLDDPNLPYNLQQLFYILYVVNQIGNYFGSDDEPGNGWEPIGWLANYPGFPNHLHDEDYDPPEISPHSYHALDGNDDCDCDYDGDLSTIAAWGYGASFRAIPAVVDLFRRTVDDVPPDTTVVLSRIDGTDVVEWNNVPVTVQLTGAVDGGNPGFPPSGTWKVWGMHYKPGEIFGIPPADVNAPSWGIAEDGEHIVECLSIDNIGNVDTEDVTVKFDGTPPEISFPDLKPLYLTSEDFIATWEAYDATSGVVSETAYLDGDSVAKDEVIDLALLAGMHTLEVYAEDKATNIGYDLYEFEVLIDADGWVKPVLVNAMTKGKGMFVAVEFPAPYDVGLIDYTTCSLIVNGVEIPAELITGVGDSDGDHNPDRMLRFDKERFAAALGGQVGDIQAEVWGGLLPDGMPRFVADVTVPVFSP